MSGDAIGPWSVPRTHPREDVIAKLLRTLRSMGGAVSDGGIMPKHELLRLRGRARRAGAELLGHGLDRCAFLIPGADVVKIARHDRGVAANLREAERWRSAPSGWRTYLMPVTGAAEDGRWISMWPSQGDPQEPWFELLVAHRLRYNDAPWPRDLSEIVPDDFNPRNWGRLDGRAVLLDYA